MPVPAGTVTGRVYATNVEYADWVSPGTVPADIDRALARASRIVDQMLLTAIYDVDDTGYPTDEAIAVALRDATCAQAEYARAAGDAASVGATQFHSFTIGSIQLGRGYNSAGSTAPGRWSQTAWEILQQAGLTGMSPLER